MKNILDIAHKRKTRQVLSCYMSSKTWMRERRPPSRMKKRAVKARRDEFTMEHKQEETNEAAAA